MKRDNSQTTEPRLFPERRLTPRWQQLAAGHQIKRKNSSSPANFRRSTTSWRMSVRG